MREDEVYFHTKEFLRNSGLTVIAGQPPRGTDRVPVIEIKSPENDRKGSDGSFKPDLVAANEQVILVVECKPRYSSSDVQKLQELRASADRRRKLVEEILQRGLLHRHGLIARSTGSRDVDARLEFAVAYHGKPVRLDDLFLICIGPSGVGSAHLEGRLLHNPWSG